MNVSQALASITAWRSSQLDAAELDSQLEGEILFTPQRLFEVTKYCAGWSRSPLPHRLLAALFGAGFFLRHGVSPGLQFFGLRYDKEASPTLQRAIFCVFRWLLPYYSSFTESAWYNGAELLNFLAFLVDGKYASLPARLAGLSVQRHAISAFALDFSIQQRQAIFATLHSLAGSLQLLWRRSRKKHLAAGQCGWCGQIPQFAVCLEGCGHSFCYLCLYESHSDKQGSCFLC